MIFFSVESGEIEEASTSGVSIDVLDGTFEGRAELPDMHRSVSSTSIRAR